MQATMITSMFNTTGIVYVYPVHEDLDCTSNDIELNDPKILVSGADKDLK